MGEEGKSWDAVNAKTSRVGGLALGVVWGIYNRTQHPTQLKGKVGGSGSGRQHWLEVRSFTP